MIAITALTGVAGFLRSVRTISNHEATMRATPRYKMITPK